MNIPITGALFILRTQFKVGANDIKIHLGIPITFDTAFGQKMVCKFNFRFISTAWCGDENKYNLCCT